MLFTPALCPPSLCLCDLLILHLSEEPEPGDSEDKEHLRTESTVTTEVLALPVPLSCPDREHFLGESDHSINFKTDLEPLAFANPLCN